MTLLPQRARFVIIGGGVAGASIAFHLAERGETDVVLLERSELTSGSTFHSAGMVGQLRSDPTLTRMNQYSAALYARLQSTSAPVSWVQSGSIRLASSPDRLAEIRRQVGWARTSGLEIDELSPLECLERFPLMSTDGVLGGVFMPGDGYLDPTQLCLSLAGAARAGGVQIVERTRVTGISTMADQRGYRHVRAVSTDQGDIECDVVINAGGMFAAEIGRMVDVRVPLVPMSHQYVVTEGFIAPGGPQLPSLRDPDLLVYFRPELDGLVSGGYERTPAAWTASGTTYDHIPADFNGRLLPEDWDRFEELAENARTRVPALDDVGIRSMINGPEAFTPDNEFILGESEVAGFFVAAGFCAHGIAGAGGVGRLMAGWVLDGEPEYDVWHMDISRFGPHWRSPALTLARVFENYQRYYDVAFPGIERAAMRPLRTSPVYGWHVNAGALMGEKSGWERVNEYPLPADLSIGLAQPEGPMGWAGRLWSPSVAYEHLATRRAAGLFDESSFAKIDITGPDAASFLQWVSANDVARGVGDVTYTQLLNHRGGIEADVTVTRLGEQHFRFVTGTAFGSHDLAWLRRQAREHGADVTFTDVTGRLACFALWGPRAVAIVTPLTSTDMSTDAFPFMTGQHLDIAGVQAWAQQVTYVGEHGWEFYVASEYALALWQTLIAAGEPHGLVPAGYRTIEAMRLEKGYRAWGTDLTPETTPFEAGLGFAVKMAKPSGFLGRDALLAAREAGLTRKLVCLIVDDPRQVAIGKEPVRVDGEVVGAVTSAGYGNFVQASIAYAYVPIEFAVDSQQVTVDINATPTPATVRLKPPL